VNPNTELKLRKVKVNILGGSVHTIKENTKAFVIDEVDLDLTFGVCAWCDELRTTVRESSL